MSAPTIIQLNPIISVMKKPDKITVRLEELFKDVAKLDKLAEYEKQAVELAGEGNEVVLTGAAPVWMYLGIAHALHGKVKRLVYRSPVTGDVVIFNHDPF